jgi:hypothetical protein
MQFPTKKLAQLVLCVASTISLSAGAQQLQEVRHLNGASAEVWVYPGYRNVKVTNTSPVYLNCRILDINGNWAEGTIAPTQHVWRTVVPNGPVMWDCRPVG